MTLSRNVWLAKDDDVIADRLLSIVKKHCKLALEHGRRDTLPERREAIRAEIERLRAERNCLLKSFELEGVQ